MRKKVGFSFKKSVGQRIFFLFFLKLILFCLTLVILREPKVCLVAREREGRNWGRGKGVN